MENNPEITNQLTSSLIAALPEEAEADYQAWLESPTEEGFLSLLAKYNIDAAKIARETVLEEEDHE